MKFYYILICAFARNKQNITRLPRCETELIGGCCTEYSSMGLGLYLFATTNM
ncbi:MAG: NADH-quinone oxidoreductase subunit H [Bacteroidetes bacterium]|nr:NADH-quinone oxidoreductase subunit H [Bacteroidota bacterium]